MNRLIAVGVLVAAFACLVYAQDALNGTWEGETRNGAAIVLTLAVKGTALTGTLVRNAESATITDGTVAKNTFAFKATLNGQTEGFSGELAGDEIKIWLDRQGPSTAIVLRRTTRK